MIGIAGPAAHAPKSLINDGVAAGCRCLHYCRAVLVQPSLGDDDVGVSSEVSGMHRYTPWRGHCDESRRRYGDICCFWRWQQGRRSRYQISTGTCRGHELLQFHCVGLQAPGRIRGSSGLNALVPDMGISTYCTLPNKYYIQ